MVLVNIIIKELNGSVCYMNGDFSIKDLVIFLIKLVLMFIRIDIQLVSFIFNSVVYLIFKCYNWVILENKLGL